MDEVAPADPKAPASLAGGPGTSGNRGWRTLGYLLVVLMGCSLAVEPAPLLGVHLTLITLLLFSLLRPRWLAFLRRRFGLGLGHLLLLTGIVGAAYLLPFGPLDRTRTGPLPATRISLGSLPATSKISCPSELQDVSITFPSANPTLREVVQAIEATGRLKCRIDTCATGASILGGSYVMRIVVSGEPKAP